MYDEMYAGYFFLHLLLWRYHKKRKRTRKFAIRPIYQRRVQQGEYHNLLQELRLQDAESHFRYLRMSKETFDQLLTRVKPLLTRRRKYSREISPAQRLAITLRYLATGNSQISLSFNFRVARSTVCEILKETSSVIWQSLSGEFVKSPSTPADWTAISDQFGRIWNFPNCIGAIDGKHVVMQAPACAGSTYYNYKGTHSIVLLAVCDAHYRFTIVDVGDAGRHSDGGVLSHSSFGQALESHSLSLPPPRPLPRVDTVVPFVFVGDEAFPLQVNMLRPYPGRNLDEPKAIFNYRLSRARRIIENSFGILAARWRIFRRPMIAKPDHVVLFTKAAIALHNFLRTNESSVYCPPGFTDGEDGAGNVLEGEWRREADSCTGIERIGHVGGNRYGRAASEVRDTYRHYFSSQEGELDWQYNHVRRTDY